MKVKLGVTVRRSDLEQWRTADEMAELVHEFDRSAERGEGFAKPAGLIKDIEEEYVPLWNFVRHWPRVKNVKLLPKNHEGADALIQMQDGTTRSVQITLAGFTQQSHFNRSSSNLRKIYFPYQSKTYDKRTGVMTTSGAASRSPVGIVLKRANAVIKAINDKQNDYSKTDILLVVHERKLLPTRLRRAANRKTQFFFEQNVNHPRFFTVFVLDGNSLQRLHNRGANPLQRNCAKSCVGR